MTESHGLYRIEVTFTYGGNVKNVTLGFVPIFFVSHFTCGAKSHWKKFQGRPRKKSTKILFSAIFGMFGNFPTTLGVWGFLKNCQTSQNWLQFLKTSVDGNISDAAGIPQSRLCILEWSNRPEILVPGLKLEFMNALLSTFYDFDQPLLCWRPPCREQYTVSLCCW